MSNRAIITLLLAALAVACAKDPAPPVLRAGYLPNISHSQFLIGLSRGDFQRALGSGVTIQPLLFNGGPSIIEALFAGRIDLACVGPNPTINGWVQSRGQALRVVAGASSGGAALVVRSDAGVRAAADLSGKRLATPQLGNTQDVALRRFLAANGLQPAANGGSVEIIPTANPQILELFLRKEIDGAWVPEPWASRLVVEGVGVVLADERELWPGGDFVTAHVIVSTKFLRAHPELVRAWLDAHVEITQWELEHSDEACRLVNLELERLTGRKLAGEVLLQSWSRMRPAWDPLAGTLGAHAAAAQEAGLLREEPDLNGVYDLAFLNDVLREKGLPKVRP